MKKLIIGTLALLLIMVAGCSGSNDDKEGSSEGEEGEKDQITLSLSIPEPEGAKSDLAAKAFKEELENLTDNGMTVRIHYNSEMGGEREVFELMGLNSLDMAIQTSGTMGNWVEEYNMFGLPFLFEDHDHAYSTLESEIVQELDEKFEEEANVKVLGYMENGFTTTSSNVPLNTPEDVKDLKIRVQENELQIDAWSAYGADATPMAWTEVFTGLQQGVIDGHSNPLTTMETSKIFEVQEYVNLIEDRFSPLPIAISKPKFDSLTEDQQDAVVKAADYAVPIGRQASLDLTEESRKFLLEQGIELIEPDKEAFKAKTKELYEEWGPKIGEETIKRVQEKDY